MSCRCDDLIKTSLKQLYGNFEISEYRHEICIRCKYIVKFNTHYVNCPEATLSIYEGVLQFMCVVNITIFDSLGFVVYK